MGRFDTTRWSVVLQARGDPAASRRALETLCRTYRPPVLAFVRGRGFPADAAEDLTQAFFARFLERSWHATADPARGRFRSFLLTMLSRFLIDAGWEASALKRGGGVHFETLDGAAGNKVVEHESPERVFEREWARAVVGAAFARLRAEARRANRLELFEHLSEFLVEPPDEQDYARVADRLNLRRNTVAVAVHRLRRRLHELVREELSDTTTNRAELDDEVRALRGFIDSA